jgi:hypothetical protein
VQIIGAVIALSIALILFNTVILAGSGQANDPATVHHGISAEDTAGSDVNVELARVRYGGTSTVLTLSTSISPRGVLVDVITGTVTLVGFDKGPLALLNRGRDEVTIRLPRVVVDAGTHSVTLRQLVVLNDSVVEQLEGSWTFDLVLPERNLWDTVFESEALVATLAADLEDAGLELHAIRSLSETLVSYSLPGDMIPFGPPELRSAVGADTPILGQPVGEPEDVPGGLRYTVTFPPTEFGSQVELSMGTIVRSDEGFVRTAIVDVVSSLGGAPGLGTVADIESPVAADGSLGVERLEFLGKYDERKSGANLLLTLATFLAYPVPVEGVFVPDPSQSTVAVTDAGGRLLELVGVTTWTGSAEMPPGTTLALRFGSEHDLRALQIVVTKPSSILHLGLATFSPE